MGSGKCGLRKMRKFPSDSFNFLFKEARLCAEGGRGEEIKNIGKGA